MYSVCACVDVCMYVLYVHIDVCRRGMFRYLRDVDVDSSTWHIHIHYLLTFKVA